MDEAEAVKTVTRKAEKVKEKSKKGGKNEKASMGIHEGHNINDVDAIEHVRVSGKDEIAEMKRDSKKDKVKKNKRVEVSEAYIVKGTEEGDLTVAYGEDDSADAMDSVKRKKKKKREKNKISNDKKVEGNENRKILDEESISEVKFTKDANKERKKQKVRRKCEDGNFEKEGERDGKRVGQHFQNCEAHDMEMVERKKRKREKKKNKPDNSEAMHDEGDSFLLQQENVQDYVGVNIESSKHDENATKELERKKKKYKNKDSVDNDSSGLMHTDEIECDEVEHAKMKKKNKNKKKKHTQLMEDGSDDLPYNEIECEKKGKKKKTKSVENDSNDATLNKSNKKVRFSDQDEVFPIPGKSNTDKVNVGEENLVRGKRFTPEEDEIVKDAVFDYIERHVLGEEGLDLVLNCKKHPKLRGCWKEIGSAIPYRPYSAVYYRAQILFRRSEDRKWTQEEYDEILNYQKEHGNDWKALAEGLGKHRFHVKDTWRRIKMTGLKKGHWSQDEYQKLFDLVNIDLQAKLSEQKISKHGMLRDNICWTAISDALSTRPQPTCCIKWYKQLTSRMVAEGEWADTDDYRLIGALYSLDATCMEDVDWDGLVENRAGDVCRKRWNQMVLHIGKHGHKSFAEQVEVLAQRYCPKLLEARETWDSKPRVP